MKIAVAVSFPLDEVSGTPIHARAIVNNLVKRGDEVFIIALENRASGGLKREVLDGVTLYRLPLVFSFFWGVLILGREKPHLISAQAQGALAWIALPAAFLRIPLVYEVHGLFRDEMAYSYGKKTWRQRFYDLTERLSLPKVRRLIVLSEKVREVYRQELGVNPEKLRVLYPAVEYARFQERRDLPGVSALRRQCSVCQVVMYAGSLYPAQGVHLLMDAVPLVLQEVPAVKFVIIGDEPKVFYQEILEKIRPFQEHVILVPYQPHEDIPSFLEVADVLVIPRPDLKMNRVSPRKMCEYMAMGKALVATEVADFKELFAKFDCGVVTACDAVSLSRGLVRVLKDEGLRLRLGTNARQAARDYFDFSKVINSYLEIYQAALQPPRLGSAAP